MIKTTKFSKKNHNAITITRKSLRVIKKYKAIKTKKQTGRGDFSVEKSNISKSLTNNERQTLIKDFAPIFDLKNTTMRLDSGVLSSAINTLITKAKQYLTKEGLHNIQLLNNKNNNYVKFKSVKEATNLTKVFDDKKLNYFKTILESIIKDAKSKMKHMTISEFNVISMQFVLLFTEIIMDIIDPKKGRVGGFENNIEIIFSFLSKGASNEYNYSKYDNMYINLINYNTNYYEKYIMHLNANNSKKIMYEYSPKAIFHKLVGLYEDGKEIQPYGNDLEPNMLIILFLGEIKLNDLTKAFMKQIYVLGMTMDMQYADTFYTTPLGFILHDITHMNNRQNGLLDELNTEQLPLLKKNETAFMQFVESEKCMLSPSEKYDIYLALFLIIHETTIEHFFINKDLAIKKYDGNYYWGLMGNIITDFNKWIKGKLFNELIPENHSFKSGDTIKKLDTLKNASNISSNEDKQMLAELLLSYLTYILDLLTETWNTYFSEQKNNNHS